MAEWNELAVLGQLVTGLFPKFAQCNLFDCSRGVAGIADPGYNIDLTRGHFPDCFADRDTFLANEDEFAVLRHRRNDDGCFAVHDCPCTRPGSSRRLHLIGYNFDMRVGEMPFAGNGFPTLVSVHDVALL